MAHQNSCGFDCIRYLCRLHGVEKQLDPTALAALETHRELSFFDFQQLLSASGLRGGGYYCWSVVPTPCIASMKKNDFSHFVVIEKYDIMVRYYEPNHGIRYLPRFLFQYFFTKYIFLMDCF